MPLALCGYAENLAFAGYLRVKNSWRSPLHKRTSPINRTCNLSHIGSIYMLKDQGGMVRPAMSANDVHNIVGVQVRERQHRLNQCKPEGPYSHANG